VTQVKTELKESKAKIEQLAKTVNDMNQVSFCYTVVTPWLLFLFPLSFYAMVYSYLRDRQFEF
jgi:hypothetical protein